MNTRTDKILGASLALAAFSFITPSHVLAQTCVTPPTCESLGYTDTAADCNGLKTLKCPLDNNKLFCVESADNSTTCRTGSFLYARSGCINMLFDPATTSDTLKGIVFDANKKLYYPVSTTMHKLSWERPDYLGDYTYISLPKLSLEEAKLDKNGKANTQTIKETLFMTWNYAVYSSTPYMLAAGELLESNLTAFQRSAQDALQKGYFFPNITDITESCIWSSTLAPDDSTYNGNAWALDGNQLVIKPKEATCAALPLKEF